MTQKEALTILKTGVNVFLTGAAGSGKTHVLREYIAYLQSHGVVVGITASTGIAATHMGGTTIHSWAGIGITEDLSAREIEELAEQPRLRKRFTETSVLIIDEVSMLHHTRLNLVDKVLRTIRGSEEPFGGIQLILCGDFFQLPPVSKGAESLFAYHADAWKRADLQICYLHEQHRQNDATYYGLLNAIRARTVDDNLYALLQSRHNKKPRGATEPTMLHAHNSNVDIENERELAKLSGATYSYDMEMTGRAALVATLQKSCLAPATLKIKKGARVMFVKNLNEIGCFNGTLGVVEHCDNENISVKTYSGKLVTVSREIWRIEEDGKVKAEIRQYPLRLAWAITVHKSQGMSLDAAIVDLRKSFAPGMGYVALSRVRSLDGLCLLGINSTALDVHSEVFEMDTLFQTSSAECVAALHAQTSREIEKQQAAFLEKIRPPEGKRKKEKEVGTVAQTRSLLVQEKSVSEMMRERDLTRGTILEHLEQIKRYDPSVSFDYLKNEVEEHNYERITSALLFLGKNEKGVYPLSAVYKHLEGAYEYDTIRLVRLTLP